MTVVPGGDRAFAHGIGTSRDLPIPPSIAIAGAVAALVISFTVLALAWRTPRYSEETSGRPAPAWLDSLVGSTAWRVALRVLGFAVFGFTVMVAILGEDALTNPFFGIVFVWWWVGLIALSLFFGPVWKAISPVRTINLAFAKLSGSDPRVGVFDYPERLGHWPAAFGLFAFVWLELVYPFPTELGPVRLWCAVYVAAMLLGGALFGDTFYERADPFEVYSTLVGKMSVWGSRDGVLLLRSPLANLDTIVVRPGLVAVLAVLFGSTAFDSFRDSPPWVQYIQSTTTSSYLLNNLALLAFCVGVGLVFALACVLTGVGPETSRRSLPDRFAHSIVPIVVGYIVAHYLTYLVEGGQKTLIQASDPFGNGSNIFGTADWSINAWLSYHPTLLANIKVVAVVTGHILGVIAAHDRAVRLLPARHQLTGQLPLLFAMVGFTAGGLYLLFAA